MPTTHLALQALSIDDFAIFGRLHPLLLHAPIGFLLAALLLEFMASKDKLARSSLGAFLWVAAVLAVFTAAAGWVLAHEEGYGGASLERHERLGIAVAVAAVLAASLHDARPAHQSSTLRLGLYRAALVAGCVLLVPTGHLGSTLTHGVDWLEGPRKRVRQPVTAELSIPGVDPEAPNPDEGLVLGADQNGTPDLLLPKGQDVLGSDSPKPAASLDTTYVDTIAPLLLERCGSCHGERKRKGGLRLDSPAALLAGGDSGPALVPGDAAASLILQRAGLPLEHEDHMPPEGKPQPTPDELAALERWIAAGASFGAVGASAIPVDLPQEPRDSSAGEAGGLGTTAEASEANAKPGTFEDGAPEEALVALDRALVHHELVDPSEKGLWIDVAAVAKTFGRVEVESLLVPLSEWVVELSLGRSAVGDEGLAIVARFPRLRRLDLRATGVSAEGLAALADHGTLEELNLALTKVGDGAVEALMALPALRRVFLWNAGLSSEALARLRALPELAVQAGDGDGTTVLEEEGELVFTSDRALPGADPIPEPLRPVNDTCPVTGSPVNPKYTLVYTNDEGSRVVGFCCPKCPGTFWDDPSQFESKLP